MWKVIDVIESEKGTLQMRSVEKATVHCERTVPVLSVQLQLLREVVRTEIDHLLVYKGADVSATGNVSNCT